MDARSRPPTKSYLSASPISPLLDSKDGIVSNRLEDLHSMGLTHQEAVVYTSLLSLGPSHARAVCK